MRGEAFVRAERTGTPRPYAERKQPTIAQIDWRSRLHEAFHQAFSSGAFGLDVRGSRVGVCFIEWHDSVTKKRGTITCASSNDTGLVIEILEELGRLRGEKREGIWKQQAV